MSDTGAAPAEEKVSTPPTTPKKAGKKAKEPKTKERAKPSHPKTADMVTAAIRDLKERGGSSLQAIKKYIATNYKVDAEKMAPFIRKYLKAAVTSGTLVQTKGKGASGSFKLAAPGGAAEKTKPAKKAAATAASPAKVKKAKAASAGTTKKAATTAAPKKQTATKKAASPKKAPAKMKEKKAAAASPKVKKAAKVPTKKPKSPKPKKAVAKQAKSPKKAGAGAAKKK